MWKRISFRIFLASAFLLYPSLSENLQRKEYGYAPESCEDFHPRKLQATTQDNGNDLSSSNFKPIGTGTVTLISGGPGDVLEPQLITTLSPFRIVPKESRYRKGRIIEIRVEGRDFFDAFLMEARSLGGTSGTTTSTFGAANGIGRWLDVPEPGRFLSCRGKPFSAVVDGGLYPIRMSNLTFLWEAPEFDVGDIFFIASIISGGRYWIFTSDRLRMNPLPGDLKGCGNFRSCFRLCRWDPTCPADLAEYIVMLEMDPLEPREVVITLGGRVTDYNSYVAIGFARDRNDVQGMDINACLKSDGLVLLGHYVLESVRLPPFLHSGVIVPDATDSDEDYLWCRFRRPVRGRSSAVLDFTAPLYHFYFRGTKNDSGLYLPPWKTIKVSDFARNLTEAYTDVQLSAGGRFKGDMWGMIICVLLVLQC